MNGKAISIMKNITSAGIMSTSVGTDVYNANNNWGNGTLAIQTFTSTKSNTNTTRPSLSYTVDVTKDGYTPLGVVGWNINKTNWAWVQRYINGNNCVARIYCDTQYQTSTSVKITLTILYMKN